MSGSNNNINQYNIDIMKSNIKRIMKEKSITQTKLATLTGIDQPRISAVLSGKSSECFTICQLVNIADALNTSTDSLLGITPTKQCKNELTLFDICKKLFEIDEIINIHLGDCKTGEVIENTFLNEISHVTTEGIYFKNEAMQNILKEWREYNSINSHNPQIKKKILQTWKKETLEDSKQRKFFWSFRNEQEQCMHLAKLIIDEYREPLPFDSANFELSMSDNIQLIQSYIESGQYYLDFNETEIRALDAYYNNIIKKSCSP